MPTLALSPKWAVSPQFVIPMNRVTLGDGYAVKSAVFRAFDEKWQIERSGLNEEEIQTIVTQLKQYGGVDRFDWSPDPIRYPLKSYRMEEQVVTRIGVGRYSISTNITRTE
jgi:phage-related protein